MKPWAAFAALLLFGVVPTLAQQSPESLERSATVRGEMDVLELEQEVDKQLLREAMLTLGRASLSQGGDEATRRLNKDTLEDFVQSKKLVVLKRAVELKR